MIPTPQLNQAAITLALYDFRPYLSETCNLVLGFLSETKEKRLIKDLYFSDHAKKEKKRNNRHEEKLHEVWEQTKDPRAVLQAEVSRLDKEICALRPKGKKYYGNMKLKTNDLNFTQKRFIEFFLLRFDTDTEKDALRQQIFQASDYDLIIENLTATGMKGDKKGRTALEPFAETVIPFMSKKAKKILPNNKEDLVPHQDKIKALDSTQRKILVIDTLTDALSDIMYITHNLDRMKKLVTELPEIDSDPIKPLTPNDLSQRFLNYEFTIQTKLDSAEHCASLSESDVTSSLAESFFTEELPKLRLSLSNLLILLKISQEKDFTEREKAIAQKITGTVKPRSWNSITSVKDVVSSSSSDAAAKTPSSSSTTPRIITPRGTTPRTTTPRNTTTRTSSPRTSSPRTTSTNTSLAVMTPEEPPKIHSTSLTIPRTLLPETTSTSLASIASEATTKTHSASSTTPRTTSTNTSLTSSASEATTKTHSDSPATPRATSGQPSGQSRLARSNSLAALTSAFRRMLPFSSDPTDSSVSSPREDENVREYIRIDEYIKMFSKTVTVVDIVINFSRPAQPLLSPKSSPKRP